MMKQLLLGGIFFCLIFCGSGAVTPAKACAGYTLILGSNGSLQQELLTQILSLLISQRTGTTIQLVRYASQAELLAAASGHEVDLLVVEVNPAGTIDSRQVLDDSELVLLEPFGYDNAQVAPVFQPAALKRFPALKRLVNRHAGLIDDLALQRLEAEVASNHNQRDVAYKFLSEQKLIFGGG
jgi:osmoprotectant transport system substrate-binding protein